MLGQPARRAWPARPSLMVASRPSTIRLADEVVYLAGGRVVDHGSHDELMAGRDGYRALVEAFEADRASSEPPSMIGGGGAT